MLVDLTGRPQGIANAVFTSYVRETKDTKEGAALIIVQIGTCV